MNKDASSFKNELVILKKIKALDIDNNGRFPVILSAKFTNTIGEIMMSYVG